jgi:hypothetical protein
MLTSVVEVLSDAWNLVHRQLLIVSLILFDLNYMQWRRHFDSSVGDQE